MSLGEPLIGAKVMQVGVPGNAVITNIDGVYIIKVPAKSTLEVSYVGYEVTKVDVNGRSKVDISMSTNAKVLDEVVAIGYGTVKKKGLLALCLRCRVLNLSRLL